MKNTINKKIKLLLTLSMPFLILNCSTKPLPQTTPKSIPSVTQPIPQAQVPIATAPINRPSLGIPIAIPKRIPTPSTSTSPQQHRPLPTSVPTPRPQTNTQQVAKYGETTFRKKFKLSPTVKETSGLIKIDNRLWTLNDSGGRVALYQINEQNGAIAKTLKISNAHNRDWEDIAYDDTYVYIGDIGNNRGNRKDLKIYKIPRASLRNQTEVEAEIINYHYSDQRNFKFSSNKHNYDCEAMVAHNGKLYLFSKNWQNQQTRLYELSTQTGTHTAQYLSTFNTQGMVTGASYNKELNILLLTTYSSLLNVKVWAFTNHNGRDFFKGNAKILNLKKTLMAQVEGITFTSNYKAYLSSEVFNKLIFSFDASLYELDFRGEFE